MRVEKKDDKSDDSTDSDGDMLAACTDSSDSDAPRASKINLRKDGKAVKNND